MRTNYRPYVNCILLVHHNLLEEGNLLSKSCNDTKGGNEYDDDSTLAPLISEEEMDVMSSVEESDDETMSTDMLENIRDGGQPHLSINRREARYKIRDCFKQRRTQLKKHYYQRKTWLKVYTSYLRLLLMRFFKHYKFWVNQDQKFLTSSHDLKTL